MASEVAHLELRVTSDGYVTAENRFGAAARSAEVFERQIAKVEAQQARAEKAAERAAQAVERAAQRAAQSEAKAAERAQTAADRKAESAEKAAQRSIAAQEKAAAREKELWNDAIQRAKARAEREAIGRDGVLPIRPSLQRIEAGLKSQWSAGGAVAGIGEGLKDALPGIGSIALAGGAAGLAAAGVAKLFETISDGVHETIAAAIEMDNLKARIAGVTGGAESANEKFEELESMTLGKLPSSVKEVSDSFIQLSNVGLDNSSHALKAYSNIAAQTGHSLGDVTSAVQMATMGNFRSLREFGVKVKEEGDNLKVTFRGQTETIASGTESIQSYLQNLGNVQFAGAVERQMDTIGGAVKKQHDAWEKLIDNVANSSLGALIEKSVGASTSIIDAMTASVDALFDRVQKGKRELESERAEKERSAALDKTMMSWADPTASRAEINRLAESLEAQGQSSADKALALYTKNEALIEKLRTLGEERVGEMTLDEASAENLRQFQRDNGGKSTKSNKDYDPHMGTLEQTGEAQYNAMVRKDAADTLVAVHAALEKQEEDEQSLYEKRKATLLASKNDETKYLQENETLWDLYNAKKAEQQTKAAEQAAKSEEEFQKRIRPFGEKPKYAIAQINTKFEGQQTDLRNLFGDRLNDDASNPFSDDAKLKAQEQYKEKSVALERERIREIGEANAELLHQSTQNAEMMFGNLATAAKNWGGETNSVYKGMFAAQKAFAVASSTVAMFQDIAKAEGEGGPYAGPAMAIKVAADFAGILAQLSSVNYAGAHDAGGRIPAGMVGLVGERGPELVRGPAVVTSRAETARMMREGGGSGGQPNMQLNVSFDPHEAVNRYLSSSRGTQTINIHLAKNVNTVRALSQR